ncbi:unnamed protein product [Porites evermanni]|uniref:Uncharacterized protein n=1 Tax=Porites evermanni TaxID=104178 RepID=A0ABN8MJB4_9CNID|nr:unnamed protein product [Porites evermanni]
MDGQVLMPKGPVPTCLADARKLTCENVGLTCTKVCPCMGDEKYAIPNKIINGCAVKWGGIKLTSPSEKKRNIGKANEKSDEELYKKERDFNSRLNSLQTPYPCVTTITTHDMLLRPHWRPRVY